MKKFKEIMAAILAVVLAVAAVAVYAPTEAHAATSHVTKLTVNASSSDSISLVSWEVDPNSIVAVDEGMTITVKNEGNTSISAKCIYKYDGTELESSTFSNIVGPYSDERSDTWTSKTINKWFTNENLTRPANLGVKYSYKIDKSEKDPVQVIVTFYDADKVAPASDAASSSNVTAHVHTWKYGTIFDATEDTDGLEGYYCSCGANKETTIIPSITAIYKNRYTQMDQAGKGEVITLKMGEWNTYSKEFMQHLISATERGVTVKLDYKYEKKNYVTTVPAGTTMDLDYDYYGPLFIQSMFETTQLN